MQHDDYTKTLVKPISNKLLLQRLKPVNIPLITPKLLRLPLKTSHLTFKMLNRLAHSSTKTDAYFFQDKYVMKQDSVFTIN